MERARLILAAAWLTGCVAIPGFSGGTTDDGGTDGRVPDGGVPGDGVFGDGVPGDGVLGDGAIVGPSTPSCAGLAATCGEHGTASCCETGSVEASTYSRSGYAPSTSAQNLATVRAFQLDTYEITVGRFRTFLDAGNGIQSNLPAPSAGAHPWIAGSGWQTNWNGWLATSRSMLETSLRCGEATWTAAPGPNENRPINCITWYEAMAFCAWDGGFLPTEAEWNAAAAGGTELRVYPWSSPASSGVISALHASYSDNGCVGCTVNAIDTAGARPAGRGRWGHAELGGNMYEMILDFDGIYPLPCLDCANLSGPSSDRVLRGGSFRHSSSWPATGARGRMSPGSRSDYIGARCARPL